MEFNRYQHIEKFGTEETENIELGKCYVFPKIDGSNGQAFIKDGKICAGSRNRELSLEEDNQGFYKYILESLDCEGLRKCLQENPHLRFVGEWLIPHSLKHYKKDAWNKFYVFDVIEEKDSFRYLPYEEYKEICDKYNINYIPPLKIITNGTKEDFYNICNTNDYLIEPGKGIGEGLVIKRYDYINKFGRTNWAKIVTSEFKELHYKKMGSPEQENILIEDEIVKKYCTEALIEKTYTKIVTEKGNFTSKEIPRLLETVFHDFIVEESYRFLKENRLPIIDYKKLKAFVIQKIKVVKKELF
jgi:hypothetical protein